MKFIAEINVMPQKEILDPQGKAVKLGLHNLGIDDVSDVRIGKHITLSLDADSEAAAQQLVETLRLVYFPHFNSNFIAHSLNFTLQTF